MLKNPAEQPLSQEVEREPEPLEFSWVTGRNGEKRKQGINLVPNPKKAYAYIAFATPLPEILSEADRKQKRQS